LTRNAKVELPITSHAQLSEAPRVPAFDRVLGPDDGPHRRASKGPRRARGPTTSGRAIPAAKYRRRSRSPYRGRSSALLHPRARFGDGGRGCVGHDARDEVDHGVVVSTRDRAARSDRRDAHEDDLTFRSRVELRFKFRSTSTFRSRSSSDRPSCSASRRAPSQAWSAPRGSRTRHRPRHRPGAPCARPDRC